MRQKRIRESFCLHLGRSQYMFGHYYFEFGEMVKRSFFRRLITNRALQDNYLLFIEFASYRNNYLTIWKLAAFLAHFAAMNPWFWPNITRLFSTNCWSFFSLLDQIKATKWTSLEFK